MPDASPRRVVITGQGLVCPLGNSLRDCWQALVAGRSGVGPLPSPTSQHLPSPFGGKAWGFRGEIEDFGPLENAQKRSIRKAVKLMCREIQMGVAAAQLALADAGLKPGAYDPDRAGVLYGVDHIMTTPDEFAEGVLSCLDEQRRFQFQRWADLGMTKVTPLWLLKYLPNMPACHIAIHNDLRGPNNSITLREASANLAIGEAFCLIARGSADIVVAGATGTRIHPVRSIHVALQEQVAADGSDPARLSRPFDLHRSGMVMGEGAGAVVLEALPSAEARQANILGEVVGRGSSTVADRSGAARRDQALVNAMTRALGDARLAPAEVGHIHAHGLATRTSDVEEARAIGQVFGQRRQPVPVTAAKSYLGNLGAGGGAVELITSLLAMQHDRLFRVLNYETPDPDCPLAIVAGDDASPGNSLLNLSVTPQGQASAIVVRRWP